MAAFCLSLEFVCEFDDEETEIIDMTYTCKASVVFTGDEINLEKINEKNHKPGKTNKDVKGIWFLGNLPGNAELDRIPHNIDKFFPNILSFAAYGCNISKIFADDLRQLPNLVLFFFDANKLVSIEANLFQNNPKLQLISFEGNLIEHVEKGFMTNLPFLKEANFNENVCIDKKAVTPQTIQDLASELPAKCPSCSIGCLNRFNDLEARVAELEIYINRLRSVIYIG